MSYDQDQAKIRMEDDVLQHACEILKRRGFTLAGRRDRISMWDHGRGHEARRS